MDYERRTGEAHEIFNQQLESMMLSSTAVDPQYSSIGANVALTNLGFDQDMGLTMKDKINYAQASLATRNAIATDKEKAQMMGEASEAAQSLRDGLTGRPNEDGVLLAEIDRKYAGNAEVSKITNSFYERINREAQAKKLSMQNQMDEDAYSVYMNTREMAQEAEIADARSGMLASKERLAATEALAGATEAENANRRAMRSGDVGAIDEELGDTFAIYYGMGSEYGLQGETMHILDNLSEAVLVSDGLEKSITKYMGKGMGVINDMIAKGIDLNAVRNDEEAIDAYIAEKKRNATVKMSAEAEEAYKEQLSKILSHYREKQELADARDNIAAKIKETLPKDPSQLTDAQKKQLNQNLYALNARMQRINGSIRKIDKQYDYRIALQEKQMETEKKAADLARTQQLTKSGEDATKLAAAVHEMNKAKAEIDSYMRVWGGMEKGMQDKALKIFLKEKGLKGSLSFEDLEEKGYTIHQIMLEFGNWGGKQSGGLDKFK